nr:FkbM family methyltransferase [Sulfolobus islandicus]
MVSISELFLAYLNSILQRLNIGNYFLSIVNYYRTYSNYIDVLKGRVLNKFPIEGVLRDGKKILLKDQAIAYYYTIYYIKSKKLEINDSFMEFEYKGNIIRFYGWKYGDPATPFAFNNYNFLNVKDKIVVDIGASIGDTAIYFALQGAKKVIAFEPFPKIFSIAKRI